MRISDWSSDVCSSDLTGDRDNPFLDRHLDAVILDPDDEFGPDRAHLHPVGADDKRALTVVRDLERCLAASQDHAPDIVLIAYLHRRIAVQRDRKSTRLNSSH